MQVLKNKITIVMYRTFGISKGRGYQPSYILKYLCDTCLLEDMYVWRIRNKQDKNSYLKSTPLFILILAYALKKLNNIFKIKKVGSYLFLLPFFDFYIKYALKDYHNQTIIFTYYPQETLLKQLKSQNNRLIFFVGQLHPIQWEEILLKEYQKISSNTSFNSLATIKDIARQKNLIKYADEIITMSNPSAISWQKYENKPIYTVALGVDLNYFKPQIHKQNDKLTFVFVGRGTYEKGIQYLIKAWLDIEKEYSNIKLILAGGINQAEKEYFDTLLSNSSSIQLIQYAPVNELLSSCDVLIHPTLAGGFEKVVLEAMASGLPIITTYPASHFVEDNYNGFVIDCCNIKDIKDKIVQLIQNKDLRDRFSQNSLKIASQNSWDRFGQEFANTTKSILKNTFRDNDDKNN